MTPLKSLYETWVHYTQDPATPDDLKRKLREAFFCGAFAFKDMLLTLGHPANADVLDEWVEAIEAEYLTILEELRGTK